MNKDVNFNDKSVVAVANAAHEMFRESYRASTDKKPDVKITVDQAWVKRHNTDQVDMAALSYFDLPMDWQSERKAGAQIALDAVLDALKNNQVLGQNFIEHTADLLHQKWLERNFFRANDEHRLQYKDLPEYQKQKDRFFVLAAIQHYRQLL